ncbi:MAG: ACT domain-containing protein, partial [Pseudoclavibacter sp.]
KAHKLDHITSEEMLELAANGAKVLHIRAVEYARRQGVTLHVRSSFSNGEGTVVYNPDREEEFTVEEPMIAGVAHDLSQAKITIVGVPDVPGKAAEIFSLVADQGANVDMIVQNVSSATSGTTDISFTLPQQVSSRVAQALEAHREEIGYGSLAHDDQIGKVTLVGSGMRT